MHANVDIPSSCDNDQIRGRCFEDCARDEEELERVRSGLADCGPSCRKHVKVKIKVRDSLGFYSFVWDRSGECNRCGGMFMFGTWYTKKQAAAYQRNKQHYDDHIRSYSIEKEERVKMGREEEAKREYDKNERKQKGIQNASRVFLKVPKSRSITKKIQSPGAVYQANRKAAMTDDDKIRAKEQDKKRKRKERKEDSNEDT